MTYIPLYWYLPEDSDLSLKHVGGFVFMDSLYFYTIYASMLIYTYIHDLKQIFCCCTVHFDNI